MSSMKMILGVSSLVGFGAGALLAGLTPPKRLSAACKCDDSGTGYYECTFDQQTCKDGGEKCTVSCKS